MNYFPNSDEEKELIRFIAKFQYIHSTDTQYFFASEKYYRTRVNNLIDKRFLKRIKLNIVLDELGIEYARLFNYEYNTLNRNVKYVPRLIYISRIAAFYYKCKTLTFIPSFDMKDKEIFTITARRFIGIFKINGIEYLTYHITKKHDKKYIYSIIYDIQKERLFKNIIILVNDLSRLNINDFIFGMNQVLVIEDNEQTREKLKYINNINWSRIITDYYNDKVYLAEYIFCDYTDYKNRYISTFYFFDTEKVNKIKYFLRENKNKNMTILCDATTQTELQKELPQCEYVIVDFKKYIEKEPVVYD